MRLQLAVPDSSIISANVFSQLFTMHALTMIFLAIMPLSVAFFNWIVPLQIGARDVAFPRLNALSYWVFLGGAIILNLGWFTMTSPAAGWFAYANLTNTTFSPTNGMDFYVLGLLVLGTSSLLGAFNFIVTIINLRAPGMSLMRMPIFTWMAFITSFLLALAMPVITIGLVELGFDRFFDTNFFVFARGGDVLLWQHLFWVFGHPEVYILILPAMGIISEILPTFSRKPLFGFPVVVFSGLTIAFLGWSVWAHHMFAAGLGPVPDAVFATTTMAIAIPTGVKVFNWLATLWGGNIQLKTPMYFALGFIALFTIGGLSGMTHAAAPSDLQQTDTYYIVAHLHYVLFGGSIMAILGGIFYWFPKMTGRMMSDYQGKWSFWLVMIGMNMTFGPMHYLGLVGMPRRNFTYPEAMGWDVWNLVASVSVLFMIAGIGLFVYNALRSARSGAVAGDDPWDARTLEWAMSSRRHTTTSPRFPSSMAVTPSGNRSTRMRSTPPPGPFLPVALMRRTSTMTSTCRAPRISPSFARSVSSFLESLSWSTRPLRRPATPPEPSVSSSCSGVLTAGSLSRRTEDETRIETDRETLKEIARGTRRDNGTG